jgi:hypothetical protein
MAHKSAEGEINKSEQIRAILRSNPKTKTSEVMKILADRNIAVTPGLVYFIKGKMKRRRSKGARAVNDSVKISVAAPSTDILGTIKKVKSLAAEVGSLKKLQAIIEELAQ